MNIPAGYQLVVESYAGDMDSFNHASWEGLSLAKVKALKAFIDIVEGMDTYSNDFDKEVQKATNHLFTEENELEDYLCLNVNAELGEYECYEVTDLLHELVGRAENYDDYNTLESYSIYFHEKELVDLSESLV